MLGRFQSLPAFLGEAALPQNRAKLRLSIRTGLGSVILIALLAVSGHLLGMVPYIWPILGLAAFKLCTNTLSWWTLRREKLVLEAATLNVVADLLAMTGAVYFTGGPASPLFAIYGIEVSVVALLSNRGTTLVVAASAFVLYGAMVILVHTGVLPAIPSPGASGGGSTLGFLLMDLALVALVLGLPALYTAAILRVLGEKERALEAKNRELVEAGRHKSQFMANITHELRTPIHGICGLSDLVESGIYGAVSDKQKQAHQSIKRSARSLLQLIDDLLELSRSDAGKTSFVAADVELAELVPSVLATIRWMQGTKELRFELALEEGLPVVRTDRGKLVQVLINLLANAVKFTHEGGVITVGARRAGPSAVTLWVADEGVGIPESELERIFEAFHQVDATAEREFGGAGIGLALVRRLADLLGARVEVESAVGTGSTFSFTLPLHHEPAPEPAKAAPAAQNRTAKTPRTPREKEN